METSNVHDDDKEEKKVELENQIRCVLLLIKIVCLAFSRIQYSSQNFSTNVSTKLYVCDKTVSNDDITIEKFSLKMIRPVAFKDKLRKLFCYLNFV